MAEKMDGMSMDLEQANMAKLRSVFPECFAEGKLDMDKLLALCGRYTENDLEKYRFEWHGKSECLRLAQKRSTGTLRPCPEESVDWEHTKNLYIEGDNLEVLKLLQTRLTIPATISFMPTILPTRFHATRKSRSRPRNPILKQWAAIIPTGSI